MTELVAWTRRGFLAGALILCAGWTIASLSFPLGWDHGLLASVGDAILAGGMPYRDAWDIKGPLAHLWFALAQFLFGREAIGIRVLDLLLLVPATVVLARTGARLTRRAAAPWIAVAFVLCYGSLTYFFTAQPDGAVALALVLGFTPLLSASVKPRQIAVAGFLVGLAILVKPLYVVFLSLPLWVAVHASTEWGTRFRLALRAVALAALPVVAMTAWFVSRGALDDLIEVHIRYAAGYSGIFSVSLREQFTGLFRYLGYGAKLPALAFLAFGFVIALRRRSYGLLLCGWLVCGLATIIVQGKYFVYHWIILFPPAILLIAIAIDDLLRVDPAGAAARPGNPLWYRVGAYAGMAAMMAPLVVQPLSDVRNYLRFATGLEAPARYYARFGHEGDPFSAADEMAAAEYIRSNTSTADRVAILGYDAPVVFLSGRTNATRFSYALPLVGWRSSQSARREYQKEFMVRMADPPTYIIVGVLFPDKHRAMNLFPEFVELLKRSYVLERSFGNVDLYRHRR